ncbi:uncharacterized protein BDV14DRAFT_185444 [Aspergillus stella-maris]|uniref:uncharacterized protein n=1 Tax=Aspergillus stella-maris TaxID=1810926 RepID=UPI003CCD4551
MTDGFEMSMEPLAFMPSSRPRLSCSSRTSKPVSLSSPSGHCCFLAGLYYSAGWGLGISTRMEGGARCKVGFALSSL